jgi:hypothetical protein
LIICLHFLLYLNCLTSGTCPQTEVIKPCTCNDDIISCGGDNSYNLKHIFQSISNHSDESGKHFRRFHLNNNATTELVEDVFTDITFDEIMIESAHNLTKIHSHAFTSTNLYTKYFFVYKVPLLSISPDYSIYTALSSMVNIEKIEMRYTDINTVQSNAFNSFGIQNKLKSIWIHNSNVQTIGNNAFYDLDNLEEIFLIYNDISSIASNAFHFRHSSNKTLKIYLNNNKLNTMSRYYSL